MLEQYWELKNQNQDSLLLFRLGDFYELFDEDAKTAAPILDIALTARNRGTENEIAMCGIPHHSANNYIIKLVQKGYKVAICDQMSDPSLPGIVERKVTQVITPGSIELLTDNDASSTYTTAINSDTYGFYIASLELTSGSLQVCHVSLFAQLIDELTRLNPAEIVIPETQYNDEEFKKMREKVHAYCFPFTIPAVPDEFVQVHYGLNSLRGLDIERGSGQVIALSMIIAYVKEHQKTALNHIQHPRNYTVSDYMVLDSNALEHLDIFENRQTSHKKASLYDLLNDTNTPQGARLLSMWLKYPLRDSTALLDRLSKTDFFYQNDEKRRNWRTILSHIGDFEKVIGKIHLRRAHPKQVRSLHDWFVFLENTPDLPDTTDDAGKGKLPSHAGSSMSKQLMDLRAQLSEITHEIADTLLEEPAIMIERGGFINPEFSPELKETIELSRGGKQWLSTYEQRERERTGIHSLKVSYNKVFGYYIEVSKSNIDKVPEDFVRKQTLVNAERYITDELKHKETEILQAEERAIAMEQEIFEELLNHIQEYTTAFQALSTLTAEIDIFSTFAELARKKQYTKPSLVASNEIHIVDGRHPVLEQPHLNRNFVPNSIHLTQNQRLLLITGPNMGGKSTILRQTALICIMAQTGSFVPAKRAQLSPLDRIFTRIGASDALTEHASTFMVEMEETSRILAGATEHSLVLLDELGRGTSTYDGLSLAWAISEALHDRIKAFTLFATHYHELISLVDTLEAAVNIHMGVAEKNGSIDFLYKLQEGGSNESYGLEVASLAGIPRDIVEKARTVLTALEQGSLWEDRKQHTLHRGNLDASDQLQLFSSQETAIEAHLKKIDINSVTPMEALQELASLKDKLGLK